MDESRPHLTRDAARSVLGSARFGHAFTVLVVASTYLSFALRSLVGWAGLVGITSGLVVLGASALWVRWRELEWHGLLPISLLAFLGWSGLSVLWSEYQWASLGSIAYQWAIAFLAIAIALTRDLIQIVRAFGDVLRAILIVSIVVEIGSGILLDMPFEFLGITGSLDTGGPIQGLLGSRNQLGLVAVIALVTFYTEWAARAVPGTVAGGSFLLAGICAALTRSPATIGLLLVTVAGVVALTLLRQTDAPTRRRRQFLLLGALGVLLIVLFVARVRLLALINAGTEFEVRYSLWTEIAALTPVHQLEGFGWLGYWRESLPPYFGIDPFGPPRASALSAFVDAWLQLGLIGLVAFIVFLGLALVRSWLLASNKRSVVYLWPALVLICLTVVSFAESTVLVEFGWLTLVVCALKASQDLSWRRRLPLR